MSYRVVIKGFDINLNKLLAGRMYDYRTKKYRNSIKNKGDNICARSIKSQMHNVHIKKPIVCHYYFYVKDKRQDRDGIISAFMKCFLDALQKCKVIQNDGWNDVLTPVIEVMEVDKANPRIEVEIEVVK